MNREGHNNENTKRDTTKRAFSRFNKLISTTCYNCRRLFFPGKHVTVDYTLPSSRAGGEDVQTASRRKQGRSKNEEIEKGRVERWKGEMEFVYANRRPRRSHFNQSSIADTSNSGVARIFHDLGVALHFRPSQLDCSRIHDEESMPSDYYK